MRTDKLFSPRADRLLLTMSANLARLGQLSVSVAQLAT